MTSKAVEYERGLPRRRQSRLKRRRRLSRGSQTLRNGSRFESINTIDFVNSLSCRANRPGAQPPFGRTPACEIGAFVPAAPARMIDRYPERAKGDQERGRVRRRDRADPRDRLQRRALDHRVRRLSGSALAPQRQSQPRTLAVRQAGSSGSTVKVRFVDFNGACATAQRRQIPNAHGFAQTLHHKPRALVADAEHTMRLTH